MLQKIRNMHELSLQIEDFFKEFCPQIERLVFLTGAGISAESGIPTFRGEEGYWTIGSKVYQPQEMATWSNFSQMPLEVWRWYLYRRAICHHAEPNPAHLALADLEKNFGDGFTLVTQNVDGLHLRAGNSFARTYQIHGNIDYMRPYQGDSSTLVPVTMLCWNSCNRNNPPAGPTFFGLMNAMTKTSTAFRVPSKQHLQPIYW
jgi:NAD-dependent deacetylase